MFGQQNYMGYQPYTPSFYPPPVPDQLAQMRAQQMQPQQPMAQNQPNMQQQNQQGAAIIWVQDERQAIDYPVAPNSSVALWVISAPVLYLKQADASGKPSMQIYDMVERKTTSRPQESPNVDYPTREEFDALIARVDAMATKRVYKTKLESKEGAE